MFCRKFQEFINDQISNENNNAQVFWGKIQNKLNSKEIESQQKAINKCENLKSIYKTKESSNNKTRNGRR